MITFSVDAKAGQPSEYSFDRLDLVDFAAQLTDLRATSASLGSEYKYVSGVLDNIDTAVGILKTSGMEGFEILDADGSVTALCEAHKLACTAEKAIEAMGDERKSIWQKLKEICRRIIDWIKRAFRAIWGYVTGRDAKVRAFEAKVSTIADASFVQIMKMTKNDAEEGKATEALTIGDFFPGTKIISADALEITVGFINGLQEDINYLNSLVKNLQNIFHEADNLEYAAAKAKLEQVLNSYNEDYNGVGGADSSFAAMLQHGDLGFKDPAETKMKSFYELGWTSKSQMKQVIDKFNNTYKAKLQELIKQTDANEKSYFSMELELEKGLDKDDATFELKQQIIRAMISIVRKFDSAHFTDLVLIGQIFDRLLVQFDKALNTKVEISKSYVVK